MGSKGSTEHPLVQLARASVEAYVRERTVISPPAELTPEMRAQHGVFVSLHRRGDLRGCIGTFGATQPNVALEVINNAIAAATEDPRFMPLAPRELDDLDISVDVLSDPSPVADSDVPGLDPKRHGVIVSAGRRRGLLLPDLEGVDTVDYQIEICRRKAGIGPNEPIKVQKFTVERYH